MSCIDQAIVWDGFGIDERSFFNGVCVAVMKNVMLSVNRVTFSGLWLSQSEALDLCSVIPVTWAEHGDKPRMMGWQDTTEHSGSSMEGDIDLT